MDLCCSSRTDLSRQPSDVTRHVPRTTGPGHPTASAWISRILDACANKMRSSDGCSRAVAHHGGADAPQAPMEAAWIDDALILGRRVAGRPPRLSSRVALAELGGDPGGAAGQRRRPGAQRDPRAGADRRPSRRPDDLAALPARLVLRPAPEESPLVVVAQSRLSLGITWACLVATAAAVALLLGGALATE